MKHRSTARLSFSLATAITALFAAQSAKAAGPYYWDNNGTTSLFGTAGGTWSSAGTVGSATQGWGLATVGTTAPTGTITTLTTDSVNFGTSTASSLLAGTVTVSGTVNSGDITFGSGSGAIVLTGGTITLAAAPTITVNNASDTINSVLAGAATSLTKAGTGILTLSGANSYSGTTQISAGMLVFGNKAAKTAATATTVATSSVGLGVHNSDTAYYSAADVGSLFNTNTLTGFNLVAGSGVAIDTTNAGGSFDQTVALTAARALTKLGTGTLVLSQANSYSGTTTVSAGTLSLTGSLTGGATNVTGGLLSITGSLTGGGAITVSGSGALNVGAAGVISGASTLAHSSSGTSIMSGANTYTGTTTISGTGTIHLGVAENAGTSGPLGKATTVGSIVLSGGTLRYSSANTNDYSGRFSTAVNQKYNVDTNGQAVTWATALVSSGGTLTKGGLGTLTLSGANSYSGLTTVGLGTLQLDMTGTGVLASTSALTLGSGSGGGTFSVKGKTSGATAQTLGALILAANTNDSIVLDPNGGTSTTLTLGNAWTRGAGSSLLIDTSSANSGTRNVKTTGAITGTGAANNGVLGYVLVKDATGIGFGMQDGSFNIVRKTTGFTTLTTANSVVGTTTTDFATVPSDPGYISSVLTLDNVAHSANTLSIDSTGGGTLDLGGGAGVLTLTAKGILMAGAGNYTIQSGQVGAAASEVIVHQTGAGTLTISSPISSGAGSLTKDGAGTLKLNGPSTFSGLATVSAGTLNVTAGTSSIGSLVVGAATYQQDGNTTSVTLTGTGALNIGMTGTSAFILNDGTFAVTGSPATAANIGNGGDTTFTQTGGLFNYAPSGGNVVLNMGVTATGSLTLNLSGGTFKTAATVQAYLGGRVNTDMNISGTALVDIPDLRFNRSLSAAHTATLNLGDGTPNSGTLKASSITKNSPAADNVAIFNFNGGTLKAGASSATFMSGLTAANVKNGGAIIDTNTFDITIAQPLLHFAGATTDSLTKNSAGTLTLTGTSTYTGTTTVSAGTLIINGSISTSILTTVASTATFGGSGAVGPLTVASGGFVTPGNSPGILTVNGNYIQAGQYTAEVAGTTAGAGYDQISVAGTVNITGGSLVTMFSGTGYADGDLLFILLNDSTDAVISTYTGLAQGATVTSFDGFEWKISYIANSTGGGSFTGGNDIALMAVPEPNTAALLGGLGVLALLRRRR